MDPFFEIPNSINSLYLSFILLIKNKIFIKKGEKIMKNIKHKKLINSVGRFGGKTKKYKDNDGNWEYETEIRNNSHELISNTNQYYMKIFDQQQRLINCWTKRTTIRESNTIIFEIFLIKNNQLYKYVKNYKNINDLTKEMENKIMLDSTFQEINLTRDTNSLTVITINKINIIDEAIKNIKLINNQIINFNEKPNNFNFILLLNIYKYLTVFEKLIDKPKLSINKSIITKISNISLGLLLITSSFIGKNIKRIVWISSYDEQHYPWQHYYQEIFLNTRNHAITFLDTVINAFVISAISNWSRDTIWNIIQNIIYCKKNKKIDEFKIKPIPINILIDYKKKYETLLYEENEENLKINMPKIKQITNFAKKINEIKDYPESEFKYHSDFTQEIEQINTFSKKEADNKPIDDIKKKRVLLSINEIINNLTKLKKSILEPLT